MLGSDEPAGDTWLRQIWEHTSDAMALSDPQGILLAANPAYYRLYGYAHEEVVGRSFALIFPSEQRAWAEAQYREIFRSDQPPPVVQSVVRRRDGQERVVESRVSFLEQDGRRTAMLSIVRDVSDQAAAEQAAARAEHNLRTVLFTLSHDIKSPLAVIKGHAQVLRRHVMRHSAPPPLERLANGLAQIESSAVDVAGLVDEIVVVATLEEGAALPLELSSGDLVEIVTKSVQRHQALADEHQLELDVGACSAPGLWDERRLGRVLDNLLSNAVKYSPNGGRIMVEVRCGQPEPRSGNADSTEPGGRRGVIVAVEDEGIGIEPQDLPHVFERFRRGGNVPATVLGSGIGLSSVQQIVHLHGGSVHVSTGQGAGTRVMVWLPVRPLMGGEPFMSEETPPLGSIETVAPTARTSERFDSGVPNLDRVLGGGLLRGTIVMVLGPPGSGKTILAQQIAFRAAERGETVLYFTAYSETHDKLLAHNHSLTYFAPDAIGTQVQMGSLTDLLEQGVDEAQQAILQTAQKQRASLVVLDGFRSMRGFMSGEQAAAEFLYLLGAKLALSGITLLVLVEGDARDRIRDPEQSVCDVILSLSRVVRGGGHRREIEVLKVRGAAPLAGLHPFRIDAGGLTVFPRLESVVPVEAPEWTGARVEFGIPQIDALIGGGLNVGTSTLSAGTPGLGKTLLGLHFLAEGARQGQVGLFAGFIENDAQLRAKAATFGIDLEAAEASGMIELLTIPPHDLDADFVAWLIRERIESRGIQRLVIDSATELQGGLSARSGPPCSWRR